MALGTTLTAATVVSTTSGTHNIALAAEGVTALQSTFGGGGKLTVCLMSYYHDYLGNEPAEGGAYTRISCTYSESAGASRDPQLKFVWSGGSTDDVYSEGTGNDDDGKLGRFNLDGTATWADMVGDIDSSSLSRNVTSGVQSTGVYSRRFAGRGAVIRDCSRSYFVFDLSGVSIPTGETVASGSLHFYLDNLGTSTGDSAKIIAVQATAMAGDATDFGNCFVADAVAVAHNAPFFGSNF